ncbi:MAG TPA: MATE family efflux transporter [Leptospiraceae bacterium]|nr:MATE family efflux transporter [Leptospiraceae bacterium]HMW04763.1 MATE family efflux transporter [Leptospiraceae bacterium]HMY33063.1 MATE family efflux transporter [Leptospiraceae bacterium]HMZ66710.1 MATE family efflux transporter [Leptospiraceae bacterium]HNA09160.1 MATE family efflux transporter [Leptospiraceae bacterium]
MQNKKVDTSIESSESIWENLKDAMKGTEADYTQINLKKAIFLLAVPMILELIMESTFAVADIYFVGKLGPSAIATVGISETFLFLLYSIAMGIATGVTAIVARRVGEKNQKEATNASVQSIWLGIIASCPFFILGYFYSQDLLRLMGADQWTIDHGYLYTKWILSGNIVIMLLFILNAIFRGVGDAAIAMRVLWIANTINIILDPILIFGYGPIPPLGIQGAAIATNIGRGTGVLVQIWTLFNAGKHIKVFVADLYWDLKTILHILGTSIGGIGQMIVASTSWIFLMSILAKVGSEAVAGSTITIRIMMFTLMPAWGMSNAAATLVGQNLGAGNAKRAESAVWKIGFYNMIFLLFVSILYYTNSKELIRIFSDNPVVIQIGSEWLQILSYSYLIYGWWMVSAQAFNGAGDTKTPTYINLIFFWCIQIPLCYYLALFLEWKYTGVFWGVFISETSVGIFTLWLFSRGSWKKTKV